MEQKQLLNNLGWFCLGLFLFFTRLLSELPLTDLWNSRQNSSVPANPHACNDFSLKALAGLVPVCGKRSRWILEELASSEKHRALGTSPSSIYGDVSSPCQKSLRSLMVWSCCCSVIHHAVSLPCQLACKLPEWFIMEKAAHRGLEARSGSTFLGGTQIPGSVTLVVTAKMSWVLGSSSRMTSIPARCLLGSARFCWLKKENQTAIGKQ